MAKGAAIRAQLFLKWHLAFEHICEEGECCVCIVLSLQQLALSFLALWVFDALKQGGEGLDAEQIGLIEMPPLQVKILIEVLGDQSKALFGIAHDNHRSEQLQIEALAVQY